jgi:hypothetical protein
MTISLKGAIEDFLNRTPCSKGTGFFLVRLHNDPAKCIDRIWRAFIQKGIPDNNPSPFIRCVAIMWSASERAVQGAARVDLERAISEMRAAEMRWVAKTILDKKMPPDGKAAVMDWASANLKLDVEICNLGKGDDNFLSADGSLLKIRSDHDGSRQRTAFMRVATHYFHELLGEWRDDWVADLANVGFPDHETTVDMVRSARRGIRL